MGVAGLSLRSQQELRQGMKSFVERADFALGQPAVRKDVLGDALRLLAQPSAFGRESCLSSSVSRFRETYPAFSSRLISGVSVL